jgi:hypothetical protein
MSPWRLFRGVHRSGDLKNDLEVTKGATARVRRPFGPEFTGLSG